jgi:hypothetical protein
MQGDFSRQTEHHAIRKGYVQVLEQQGRVGLDADHNEQQALHRYRIETEAQHTIGLSGTPKHAPGFGVVAAGNSIQIGAGSYYVDGILCQNDQTIDYANQPFFLDPPALAAALAGAPAGLIYLDVWYRHITVLDDDYIREQALGGQDTTTRLQAVWQVKVLPLAADPDAAALRTRIRQQQDLQVPEWAALTAPRNVTLDAQTQAPQAGAAAPCDLPAESRFQGRFNSLYRVQVQRGGNRAQATFKWSRENGTVVAAIEQLGGTTIVVRDTGRDEISSFAPGGWVEIVNDANDLAATPTGGDLVQIDRVEAATREIILPAALPVVNAQTLQDRHYKLRRWDQVNNADANGVAMTNDWIDLELGIQVRFADGDYRAGDYWLIPARTEPGDIEWPPYELPGGIGSARPPFGETHHYAPLAVVRLNGGVAVDDLRLLFPPLTDIAAVEVSFDGANCGPDLAAAETVQAAIEVLCQRQSGSCTYTVAPGPGWEQVFGMIQAGEDAQICFRAGEYLTANTIHVADKGHLTLSGIGPGTRLRATGAEAVLHFENCAGVTVRSMAVTGGQAGDQGPAKHLNGALTFCGCDQVTVENVALRCAAGARQLATCLSVYDRCDLAASGTPPLQPLSVRIRHCTLAVGHWQTGILVVNATRAHIEDNEIRVVAKPSTLTFDRLMTNRDARAAITRTLISNLRLDAPVPAAEARGNASVTLRFGNQAVHFVTPRSVANEWQAILDANPPARANSARELADHIYALADSAILNRGIVGAVRGLRPWFTAVSQQNPAAAAQGIVVAGREGDDLRILNNTIVGAMQGIRVGMSRREAAPAAPLRAQTVLIANNTIRAILPAMSLRERYGIFVGNCDSLVIENNYTTVQRFSVTSNTTMEGIRVFGHLGRRIIVRQNHVEQQSGLVGYTMGIRVNALNPAGKPQWYVADNLASVSVNTGLVEQSRNYA